MKIVRFIVAMLSVAAMTGCCDSNDKRCGDAVYSKQEAVIENILTRRSIRDYKEEPVSREEMGKILECGIYAPSAMNMQTWAVRVVDNKSSIPGIAIERFLRVR